MNKNKKYEAPQTVLLSFAPEQMFAVSFANEDYDVDNPENYGW